MPNPRPRLPCIDYEPGETDPGLLAQAIQRAGYKSGPSIEPRAMLLARRNLFRDRTRFLLSVLGVAVSVGLILLLAGYRAGVYLQSSAYLDNTPGSVIVAERGIRDFLSW